MIKFIKSNNEYRYRDQKRNRIILYITYKDESYDRYYHLDRKEAKKLYMQLGKLLRKG